MKIFTWVAVETSKAFVKIFATPWYGRPRGIFVTISRDFQLILKLQVLIYHHILCGWIFIFKFDRSLPDKP